MRIVLVAAVVIGSAIVVGSALGDVVGFWTFDDIQNGVIPDQSGNGLDALMGRPADRSNDPSPSDNTPSGAPGDRSIHSTGDGGVVVGDYESRILDLSSGEPITMEVWLYPEEDVTDWTGLVQYGQSGQGYKIGIRGNAQFLFTLLGVVDVSSPYITIEPDGEWHHLAVTYEPGVGVGFFHNGEEIDWIQETRDMIVPAAKELWIGCEYGARYGFSCSLDRVRISKALLTAEELDSDPQNPKPPTDTTLFYMTFDEESAPYTTTTEPKFTGVTSGEWLSTLKVPEILEDGPSGTSGDFSLSTKGAGELVHVPDPDGVLNFFEQDFTLEAWIKYNTLPFNPGRLLYYGEADTGYDLAIAQTSGLLRLNHESGTNADAVDAAVPGDDNWHHIAAVNDYTYGFVHFYVDGELLESVDNDAWVEPAVETQVLFIGAMWDSRMGYAGQFDRIRISDEALAADQLDSTIPVSVTDWPLMTP